MDLIKSIMIAATGLRAQSGRMRVISENLANASSTASTPEGNPYRRRVSTFKSEYDRELKANTVRMGRIELDKSEFGKKLQPGHPAADANGYVKTSNVNSLIEMMDIKEAQRSYEANLNVVRSSRQMILRTIDILKV